MARNRRKLRWWDRRPSYIRGAVSWWDWHARPTATQVWWWASGRCTICGLRLPKHKMGCSRR